jgi:hypothetical protein
VSAEGTCHGEGNHSDEASKLCDIHRSFESKNSFDHLSPRFQAGRREPVSKPISFFHRPLAFKRIHREIVVLKTLKNLRKKLEVRFPRRTERLNVVNVYFCIVNVTQDILHDLLRKIRQLFDAHWQSIVSIVTVWSDDGTKVLRLFVELEGIVCHTDVEPRKVLVAGTLAQDVDDVRQGVNFALDELVERSKVADPAHSTVLLWDDESGSAPFRSPCTFENAKAAQVIKIALEDHLMYMSNGVRTFGYRLHIWKQVQMELAMRIASKIATEKLLKALEDVVQVSNAFDSLKLDLYRHIRISAWRSTQRNTEKCRQKDRNQLLFQQRRAREPTDGSLGRTLERTHGTEQHDQAI